MAEHDEMARSFGAVAGTYDRGRPTYPLDAVRWMLEPAGESAEVVDVGAGTGKLTRVILDTGARVVAAVDHDGGMLAQLAAGLPGVATVEGAAEALPLQDASADAVLFGQAWHWVAVPRASAEAARVVRPGGVLGLVWNLRDESVPWVAELTGIMHGSHAEETLAAGPPQVDAPFGVLAEQQWRWSRAMTRDDLLAMARSRSYIITASDDERTRIEAGLADLFDRMGAVGDTPIELPYVTRAFRAVRP